MKLFSPALSGLFATCFLFYEERFSLTVEASTNEENSSEHNLDKESYRHPVEEIGSNAAGTFKSSVTKDDISILQQSRRLQTMLNIWAQEGNTVSANSSASNRREGFGKSVALSRNGKTLVVGAHETNSDQAGNADGKIQIYTLANAQWNLMQTIFGVAGTIEGYKGQGVSINPRGKYIAVHNGGGSTTNGGVNTGGSFSVYKYDGATATYQPLGNTIAETTHPNSDGYKYSSFGRGIDISDNGKRVALGSPDAEGMKGRAYVYEYDSTINDWQMIFDTIGSGSTISNVGSDVSLAGDGKSIVVSSRAGSVDVFKEDSSSNWSHTSLPLTNPIFLGASFEGVSISADGLRVALADYILNNNVGGTYVFDKVGSNWVLDGSTPLMGVGRHSSGDHCGGEVVISADGKKIIMACTGVSFDDGYAIVYEVDGAGIWSQAGDIILTTPSVYGSRVHSVDIAVQQGQKGAVTRVAVGSNTVVTLDPIGSAAVHKLKSIPCVDSNAEMRMDTTYMDNIPFFCRWVNKGEGSTCDTSGLLKEHCPKSCGTCTDYICSDSMATFVVNGSETSCLILSMLPDPANIEVVCQNNNKIRRSCRHTCGYCGNTNPVP